MIYLLLAVHIYFTLRLRFVQKHTFVGVKYTFFPDKSSKGIGTYKAFAAALGTTVGPGNIMGVAVAISIGGSGAVFWMWISGILSMATKYAESFLSLKYKKTCGGSAALLYKLGNKKTAVFWTVACCIGGLFMGAAVPANSLSVSLSQDGWIVGVALCLLVSLTVSCGFDGIANVSALLVPVMSFGFTAFCLAVIAKNAPVLPKVLTQMLKDAFGISPLCAASVGTALKEGVKRGLYSNESGLGTGGVLAAESGDENIELSSLAAMTTAFWDTVVMCAITGVMFLCTGAKKGMPPAVIMNTAFESVCCGKIFLAVSMSLFVYATVIGWYYIAKRAAQSLFATTSFYDILYIAFCFFGAVSSVDFIWKTADCINIALLMPSVYALLRLSGKINLYRKDK